MAESYSVGILSGGPSGILAAISARRAGALKDGHFRVLGTRGWNEAEFTCGGVDAREVRKDTLESLFQKGLYFCWGDS